MEFSLTEVREATGGELLGTADSICTGITIDSRRVKSGDLFIAIVGEHHDGHAFVPAAVAAGASAVVISRAIDVPGNTGVVRVSDTTVALGDLARLYRRRFALPVVAITGSTGKTTVKEMVAAIGAVGHRVAKTSGNQNNEIGLPLTLLGLRDGDELLVVEMGMRGAGQIAALTKIAEPVIGLVTNIGLTHMELLGTQDAIAMAKGELLEALPAGGTAVLNADDHRCLALKVRTRARVLTFGLSTSADIRAIQLTPIDGGTVFTVSAPGWPDFTLRLPVPGHHHVLNALAAAAVVHALGYQPEDVQKGLGGFGVEPGRGAAIVTPEGWTVIDDTYNASPASVEAALRVLAETPASGRRIAVLGEMLELGPAAASGHRSVGEAAAGAGLSWLLTTGELALEIVAGAVSAGYPATMARHYQDKKRLITDLRNLLRAGDLILVKGSRGVHMEDVVSGIGARPSSKGV